jgi:hypothetical protein
LTDRQKKIAVLIHRLTTDVPADTAQRNPEQHARWLLAYILDWHRREEKAAWWEYFRLCDLSAEDLLEERAALSGLTFVDAVGGTAGAPIHHQENHRDGNESSERTLGQAKQWPNRPCAKKEAGQPFGRATGPSEALVEVKRGRGTR